MTPPWEELFCHDKERQHSFDEAVAEYKRLLEFYPRHGYSIVEIPKDSVEKRIEWILKQVFRFDMQYIETERLILRKLEPQDLIKTAEINQDPAFYQFLSGPLNKTETAAMIEDMGKHWEKHGLGFFACTLKKTKELIGYIGLNIPDFESHFTPCVEISWYFAPRNWGNGYATEAAHAVLKAAFEDYGLQEVVSFTVPANARSIRVMEKIGMIRDIEGDFDHPKVPLGNPLRRHILYRITKEQYEHLCLRS